MKFSILYIILFIISATGNFLSAEHSHAEKSDSVEKTLEKAREYFDYGKEEESLKLYLSVLKDHPENYEALWNTSFIYTRKGRQQTTYKEQMVFYEIAKDFARLTIDAHPDKPRSYYVYAVASAGLADDMPNSSERIKLSWNIIEYAEKALQMDPSYAPAWHLIGLWNSNIANISRTERFAARVVYGSLPEGATNAKAEHFLKKAVELDPSAIIFKLDLAQHYQENGQEKKAKPLLESIFTMQADSQYDKLNMAEARERYNQLR